MASTLGKKALGTIENEEICLVYCFPTQQVYPLHMKSGWLDVCVLQEMFKPINLRNMLGRYFTRRKVLLELITLAGNLITKTLFRTKKPPEVDGLTINEVSYFDDRFDAFWERVSIDYSIIVVRDRRYLNWRYVDAPNARYTIYVAEREGEICGYVVLGDNRSRGLVCGYIYDVIASLGQEDIIQCLVSKAIEHFQSKKADVIFCKMVSNKA